MVEKVFCCKKVPKDKKIKPVALKLRKYASLWWTSLTVKRTRKGKGKIRKQNKTTPISVGPTFTGFGEIKM